MRKNECIERGFDLKLCSFHEFGHLSSLCEKIGNKRGCIAFWDESGNIIEKREWNRKNTRTFTVERYYSDGKLKKKYEWDSQRKRTWLSERVTTSGNHFIRK